MMFRLAPMIATLTSVVVLSAVAQEPPTPQTPPGDRISIVVSRGLVTASIQNSALLTVLDELSARARVTIIPGPGLEGEQVSANLENVPVDQAVRDLLKSCDTFFYYSPARPQSAASLRAVWVYPRGAAATLRPVPLEEWGSTGDIGTALAARDPAVREQAYEALMSRPDAASRNTIVQAIRGATETDGDVRQRLLSTALSQAIEIPPDVLADLVRGDGVDEIRVMALEALTGSAAAREVAIAALTDPSQVVRERAKDILEELDSLSRRREPIIR